MKLSPFPKNTYQQNALVYKVLANPKRLEILNILKVKEVSVEELSQEMGAKIANVSQHLAILRMYKLVKVRRQGQKIFYSIVNPQIIAPCKILHDMRSKKLI
jgi:DNA-binding transcriptional ArsR family regulator